MVPELCPIGATTMSPVTQRIRRSRQEVYYDDGENMYMMEDLHVSNQGHGHSYPSSTATDQSTSLVPELDGFGFDHGLHGVPSGSDMEGFDTSGDDPILYSAANASAIRTNPLTVC